MEDEEDKPLSVVEKKLFYLINGVCPLNKAGCGDATGFVCERCLHMAFVEAEKREPGSASNG